ncbi:MAG: chemotaxis protein CheA, partial [Pseudomonadota bacterium]
MANIKVGYFQECEELLEQLTDGLDALAGSAPSRHDFDSVFRAVHSIKGGAAAFALHDLTDFAHALETLLGAFRESAALPSPGEVRRLQRGADRLAQLIGHAQDGRISTEEERLADAALLNEAENLPGAPPLTLRLKASSGQAKALLKALPTLGEVQARIDEACIPSLEDYDPAAPCLVWEIELTPSMSEKLLEKALKDIDPTGALMRPARETSAREPGGPAPREAPAARLNQAMSITQAPTIRVGLDRIDRLINLVGELVINQAMLARSAEEMGARQNSDHMIGLEDLMRLSRDLQDSVMQIRAQPVKPLFQRMARICREATTLSGKSVELICEGQETEIDKTVIERLADPLTHMIRNAVDHAIEPIEARIAAGKPETGRIFLSASHRSGQVILETRDDGRGIDRAKVLARARAKGLIAPGTELTESEIDQLLFKPGFSTADEVSSLSGRGVGMDVVRSAIHALGGRINIESTPGRGTRFEIALPLTLAVLDAMTVAVADQTLVVPLSTIHETITIAARDVLQLSPGQKMLRYNGQAIALFDLGEVLGYPGTCRDIEDRVVLITCAEA